MSSVSWDEGRAVACRTGGARSECGEVTGEGGYIYISNETLGDSLQLPEIGSSFDGKGPRPCDKNPGERNPHQPTVPLGALFVDGQVQRAVQHVARLGLGRKGHEASLQSAIRHWHRRRREVRERS